VSAQMSRMPRSSTGPEVALRRRLHAAGLRFRIHPRDLPGRPDIALTRAKMAVFVDGCFWHGCTIHGVLPKHNREWWLEKLRANSARDSRNDARLTDAGWLPVHIWEHEPVDEAVDRVVRLWRERTGRAATS
jgi:DNA mismatch endonuclease (patch repair protein)